ncbi:ABC-2 type transport system ATP-binding protein [Arachidicoccus rhizosphaerae]|jgi:ABC-2 type transport system ATP-binding protein|uniref:ABC-2 type transport system ATP-binding protein n=1 Tax=Arachidicoccus rhizosphaerae TaxID=551991 RepID=A0A1H4C4E5_9BACT|nr:ABC transporter ATP-binding protein [Arachidicoccus rhizosphaerae]SEA55224.1 ABC-2 type transport system ATP-binding protein [Arachidicoccus rhizosphaerae]
MIKLLNFRKKYHLVTVLDLADWQFEKGIYHLKGANGSGKSTLLQSIAARLPFEGDILIGGNRIKKSPKKCRADVSYATGEPLFPEFISGEDLYDFFLKTKGSPAWSLEELMEGFGTAGFLQAPTGTYSSGMLKKLELLLAFTGHPKWILLDEPFNGLDIAAGSVLTEYVNDLSSRYGVGFIIASHQHHEALLAGGSEKVVLLENGKLKFV